MPPRLRSSLAVAFLLLVVYLVLTHDAVNFGNPVPPIVLTDAATEPQPLPLDQGHDVVWIGGQSHTHMTPAHHPSTPTATVDAGELVWTGTPQAAKEAVPPKEINFAPGTEEEHWDTDMTQPLHAQYQEEYARLGKQKDAGKIFGGTLSNLVDSDAHAGFRAAALTPTGKHFDFTDQEPLNYNPYPDYLGEHYKKHYQGDFVDCAGPGTGLGDVEVFSGHSQSLTYPQLGAYYVLDMDSNLCFERETRLGPYGFLEPGSKATGSKNWDTVDWGQLQETCAKKNQGRFNRAIATFSTLHMDAERSPQENITTQEKRVRETTLLERRTTRKDAIARRAVKKENHLGKSQIETRDHDDLHDMTTDSQTLKPHARTAVLLRANSTRVWSENDKQNIRAMVAELSLLSGGEYQVFILFQILDNSKPIFSDPEVYSATLRASVPQEFRSMTVLYNDQLFEDIYTKTQPGYHSDSDSHWLPVQKFALDYSGFDYYWNWDLDSRYTGHYYNFLEKLGEFADMQPRKGLWERNERYYIPEIHGAYASEFRSRLELKYAGAPTQWGPLHIVTVDAIGPNPPVDDPIDDNYEWGVHEQADFISLAPIFNTISTNIANKDDVWGYLGPEVTPRRSTHTLQSRLSKKLLQIMHAENLAGNHLGSHMAPATVSLLHGLKAVYAPHPIFLDREWKGKSLNRWFNPGPHGESGSTQASPFSTDHTQRFQGVTWGTNSDVPTKMYRHWLGLEDGGIGGQKWEKTNGRTCLPPMLLYPVQDVETPPQSQFSPSQWSS
ncbi:hypothetical protein BP5796_04405 [Coleophoma crateriformis]|uniref:Uncharacterized protein n=1 Tax=Coleophoma crateriformis TaxID=565419 RepID=A0A3D8S9Y6_9HELO|nr:hypothetical protein BP5796_04405 [Coleophoma crateriformis]